PVAAAVRRPRASTSVTRGRRRRLDELEFLLRAGRRVHGRKHPLFLPPPAGKGAGLFLPPLAGEGAEGGWGRAGGAGSSGVAGLPPPQPSPASGGGSGAIACEWRDTAREGGSRAIACGQERQDPACGGKNFQRLLLPLAGKGVGLFLPPLAGEGAEGG